HSHGDHLVLPASPTRRSSDLAPLRSVPPQSCSTRHAPQVANRLGLTRNVGAEGRVVIPLQPHFDEGPEDDLEAHRALIEVGLKRDRKSTRLNSSHVSISYAVF